VEGVGNLNQGKQDSATSHTPAPDGGPTGTSPPGKVMLVVCLQDGACLAAPKASRSAERWRCIAGPSGLGQPSTS
jgi:hypothetical protein